MRMKKHDIEFIRSEFKKHGYTLISDKYEGMRYSLEYTCAKHPDKTSRMSYGALNQGTRCRYCKAEERRLPIELVRAELLKNNCELVSESYEGNSKPIKYRCLSHPGEVQTSTLNNIQKRKGCKECRSERLSDMYSGDKHYAWKGGCGSETHQARKGLGYSRWRCAVFKNDNFTCQCCGDSSGGNLEAHHIENFSNNISKRFLISNGITMCFKCHNPKHKGSFHNLYGTRNNNVDQLIEYLASKGAFLKGVFSIEENLKGVLEEWRQEA